ncbi:MAG: hypothetical protein EPO02_07870 [Nitrospirae bacterium]|nr:MAG: hypothetical protein EPO02_07870 [Nitrospirota bacterium]
MNGRDCWGIFRERAHSPGREFDDAEILRLTGKHLEARGFQVSLRTPDEVARAGDDHPPNIFLMCERLEIIEQLRQWEELGVRHVNRPSAILHTYRDRMLALFERHGVAFPASRLTATAAPEIVQAGPVWVKRADVHNTQDGDVVFATTPSETARALARMAERGIGQAVLQEHVPGDLIKFYGIGDPALTPGQAPWFRWFYHKDQTLAGHRFDRDALASMTQRAAAAIGLEVYGGDAIATGTGALYVIDLNAWPSFALYRDEASERIASYLAVRFTGAGA